METALPAGKENLEKSWKSNFPHSGQRMANTASVATIIAENLLRASYK
jgi:hypothetical protein